MFFQSKSSIGKDIEMETSKMQTSRDCEPGDDVCIPSTAQIGMKSFADLVNVSTVKHRICAIWLNRFQEIDQSVNFQYARTQYEKKNTGHVTDKHM